MTQFIRPDIKARYELFNKYALNDQRNYYNRTIDKHRTATRQVNLIRASFALTTAVSSALAGLLLIIFYTTGQECSAQIVQQGQDLPAMCTPLQGFIALLVILSIAMPALGGFFTSLADLYQWDRLISIYESAVENIEVADSRSPDDDMTDVEYRASLRAFVEGTLQVMSDETAQWGQSIRTPRAIEEFIAEEQEKAQKYGGDANAPLNKTDTNTPTKKPDVNE